jgi:hypothetical protein
VRIGDIINLIIPPAQSSFGGSRGVQSLDGGGGNLPGRSNFSGATALAPSTPPPNQITSEDGDYADLSSLFASRSGAADPAFEQVAPTADPFANGATILDSFVRKRAILSYRFPQLNPNGPQIDLTFDIEIAYRRIDILPAGQNLDTQG